MGTLHYHPILSCGCGARVLELLTCESCGEVFLGGYRRPDPQNPGAWFLSPDHPDLEASPEMAFLDREYMNYALFWPSTDQAPLTPQWQQAGTRRDWRPANLSPVDGSVTLGGGNGYLYHVPSMHRPNPPTDRQRTAALSFALPSLRCGLGAAHADSVRRLVLFGRVSRRLHKYSPMRSFVKCLNRPNDRTASLLSSRTAARMRPSFLPACDSRTIAMRFDSPWPRPSVLPGAGPSPSETNSRGTNLTKNAAAWPLISPRPIRQKSRSFPPVPCQPSQIYPRQGLPI